MALKNHLFLAFCLFSIFSCDDGTDDGSNPTIEKCNWIKWVEEDPDAPQAVKADFDDKGRIIKLTESDDDGDYEIALVYDANTGFPKDSKQVNYEFKVAPGTGEIVYFRIGDEQGAALRMVLEDNKITMTSALNDDLAGLETDEYEYDDNGNATRVTATGRDEDGEEVSSLEATLTYDMAHEALFADVPFLQGLASFNIYGIPFGLSNKNLLEKAVIKFVYENSESTESREFIYSFTAEGRVQNVSWTSTGGTFTTNITYDCD